MRALITGVTGQDGALLAHLLLTKGYQVFGTYRRLSTPNFWRLQHLGILPQVNLIPADLLDSTSLVEAIRVSDPDEVYNLAAQSFVGASFEQPIASGEITGLGVTRILEAIRQGKPTARFYQASTSELYGLKGTDGTILDEDTPFQPSSPYAIAKLSAYWTTRVYREGYGIFAANGILFNHESALRGLEFVSRKVTNAAARIKLGLQDTLELGNMDAKRDWGYAPEYVESMWLMLQQDEPGDFVIATGETHSVEELCQVAFRHVGMDWRGYVSVDKGLLRPIDVKCLCGDSSKAERVLGWSPKVKFAELVELMVDADLRRWKRWKDGETFPWDAVNYPDDVNVVSTVKNRGG
ncbi:MAG: GDP-mannose 4,6-dehydratase [Candidatus Bathyanammoxibius sp.]